MGGCCNEANGDVPLLLVREGKSGGGFALAHMGPGDI